MPWGLHERLWPIKYMIFLVLFGLSLYSLADAERWSEVEPFKTAIILHFVREWWFVLFAVALLAAGLVHRALLLPLSVPAGCGAGDSRAACGCSTGCGATGECGNPCQRCANECPVQAIHPEGHINPNECIHCMHCQVLYHHDQKCPVMIQRASEAREARRAGPSPSMQREGRMRASRFKINRQWRRLRRHLSMRAEH